MTVQNRCAFLPRWPNYVFLVATKWLKIVRFWPLSEKVFMQPNSNLVCTLIVWLFRIDFLFGHVGEILFLELPWSDWKWWCPTIIWKSMHTIQFRLGVYTFWVIVKKWFAFFTTLAKFWPSSGRKINENDGYKIAENDGFLPLSGKIFMQSNSNLVSTLLGRMFRIYLLSGHGQIMAL